MKFSIGQKMGLNTVLFSLATIVPFVILGVMAVSTARDSFIQDKFEQLVSIRGIKKSQIENFTKERQGDMGVLVETVKMLRKESLEKLMAVREVKRASVERYFQSIHDQIITFSEDRMVIDAMHKFRNLFGDFRKENNLSSDDLEHMHQELLTYYTGDFSEEYRKQNTGKSINAESYFRQLDNDSVALQYFYIKANKNPLGFKHQLERADDRSGYSEFHSRVHPIMRSYLEKFGYYDIFLVDSKTGDIVYTVFKELDYSTSLIDGPYAQTNLGKAFRKANAAVSKDTAILVDYERYPPSYEAPASFIASPIYDGTEKIGVAIFQMPIDRLNAIMSERAGLGKTGETYLVGSDYLMRSDSYLDPTKHSVVASFRTPSNGKVETDASKKALAGETGAEVIIDYNGSPVVSAYSPVKAGDITWGLLAEIDVAEAFCPKDESGSYFFTKYKEMYGYYDFFLINPDGYCFFTAAKEADYQTNLVSGKYSNSGLGKLVKNVLQSKKFGFVDFSPYAPSNDEPAAFIAQPVDHNGEVEIIVALQMSLNSINSIMQIREGMGKTGETYLVGPDKLMRSDSYLDPTGHSVKASFANPDKGGVDTEASREALAGKSGSKIVIDYNGNPVLSAYTPLKIWDTTWALLAEIDEQEVIGDSVAAMHLLKRVWMIGVVSMAVVLAVILMSAFLIRNLSKTLRRITHGMSEGSDQVASASEQVSSASQQLAEGSSEQAASIEETSSSLEEMSSMTRQNAENSKQADSLMKATNQVVTKANDSMSQLISSMVEISKASEETSKIIKTIDEIAFQTNLLALNAAVEAARAGEAGAGFAVVANEVRNLAMRAADAAKSTTDLIEGTVKKVKAGGELVATTNEAFTEVATSAAKVTELVGEIAAASIGQAQGIDQINKAVAEMDKVVQQGAANAEESAAAAEEMSAQANQMKANAEELNDLVNGSGKKGSQSALDDSRTPQIHHKSGQTKIHESSDGRGNSKTLFLHHQKEKKPEEIIPMEDDFSDF